VDTDAALKSELNTSFDQMQVGFDQYLERRYGALARALTPPKGLPEVPAAPGTEGAPGASARIDPTKLSIEELRTLATSQPGSYIAQLLLGRAAQTAGNADEAVKAFERAALLAPTAAGADSPHAHMAEIALKQKDFARAISELQALLKADFNNVAAARELATLLKDQQVSDPAVLRPVYERIAAVDPFDADAHAVLGRLALQRKDAVFASREFRAVLALGPVDQAAAHTDLAESYVSEDKRAEARKEILAALEIAPSYERAQGLLLGLAARP
jgi:tetratricopeptide (TPR) repeat protein